MAVQARVSWAKVVTNASSGAVTTALTDTITTRALVKGASSISLTNTRTTSGLVQSVRGRAQVSWASMRTNAAAGQSAVGLTDAITTQGTRKTFGQVATSLTNSFTTVPDSEVHVRALVSWAAVTTAPGEAAIVALAATAATSTVGRVSARAQVSYGITANLITVGRGGVTHIAAAGFVFLFGDQQATPRTTVYGSVITALQDTLTTTSGKVGAHGQVVVEFRDTSTTLGDIPHSALSFGRTALGLTLGIISGSRHSEDYLGLYESLLAADRPLAWWGLDATNPTADSSYYDSPLSVGLTAPAGADSLVAHGDEGTPGSRLFNGSSTSYWTTAQPTLDAIAATLTIHALVRPTTSVGTQTLVAKRGSWSLRTVAGALQFAYTDRAGSWTVDGPTLSAGSVHQVIVSDDASYINFWIDGTLTRVVRPGVSQGYTTTTYPVSIGADWSGVWSQFYDGRIDEVALWNVPFTASMVAAYWQAQSEGIFGTKIIDEPGMAAHYPWLKIEIAWASNPTDACLIWEDVTDDLRTVQAVGSSRGRNFELDRFGAGQLDFTLSNRERTYDPDYSGSPFYPDVVPTRPVRLRAQATANMPVHSIFFGYTEGPELTYPSLGLDALAGFTAIDPFKALTASKVLTSLVRPEELSGARLEAFLGGMAGIPLSIEAGQSEIIGADLQGSGTLDHAQAVAETEGGVFLAGSDGYLVFQDRHHRTKFERTARATYGDTLAELPFRDIAASVDESRLLTAISIKTPSDATFTAENTTSSTRYFQRTREMTTLHASDIDAEAMTTALSQRYGTPALRIPVIQVEPAGYYDPQSMWELVLGHDISHRIRVVTRPIGDTTTVSRDLFIEGVKHTISQSRWVVELSVSPSFQEGEYWLLGEGTLGTTSGLTSTMLGW